MIEAELHLRLGAAQIEFAATLPKAESDLAQQLFSRGRVGQFRGA